MLWNIVISILLSLLAGVMSATQMPLSVALLPAFAASIFYVLAVFCLTSQEPRNTGVEESVTLRTIIRVSVLLSCAGSFIDLVAPMLTSSVVPDILATTLQITGLVAMIGIFLYLRRFALRIPNEKLAKSTRTVMWGLVISMFLVFLMAIVAAVSGTATGAGVPGGAALAALGSLGCVGGVGALVFSIWNIRLLYQYRDAFKLAAEQSTGDLVARQQASPTNT